MNKWSQNIHPEKRRPQVRNVILSALIAGTLLTGCAALPLPATLGGLQGESAEAKAAREEAASKAAREEAENVALSYTSVLGGSIDGSEQPAPAEMVLATQTELAPYDDFVQRGLVSPRTDGVNGPVYMVHTRPKEAGTGPFWLVRTFIQNGSPLSQSGFPWVSPFDPLKTEATDKAAFQVSEPFPTFGNTVTFTIKGLVTVTKPIKFYLNFSNKYLSIGEATPVDGTVTVSVPIMEAMGSFADGSPARMERGRFYGLAYFVDGMTNESFIRGCPAGIYLSK